MDNKEMENGNGGNTPRATQHEISINLISVLECIKVSVCSWLDLKKIVPFLLSD